MIYLIWYDKMENDKITICSTNPITGKVINTDCTKRSLISLLQVNKEIDNIDIDCFKESKLSFTGKLSKEICDGKVKFIIEDK